MNYLVISFVSLLIVVMISLRVLYHFISRDHYFEKSYVFWTGMTKNVIQWQYFRQMIVYIICGLAILWYLLFRYFPLFSMGVDQGWLSGYGRMSGTQDQINYNKGWSMVLMLDLCSLLGLVTPLVILLDRKQVLTPAIGCLSILGAGLTFYGGYLEVDAPWTFSYLLFGNWSSNNDLPLSFMLHMWMMGLGLYVLLWKRRWTLKDNIIMCGVGLVYMAYVLIVTRSMQITSHATALVINDFIPIFNKEHAVYSDFKELFGVSDANWNIAIAIAWITFFITANFLIPPLNLFACWKQNKLNNTTQTYFAE